jgi:hypothetical protein
MITSPRKARIPMSIHATDAKTKVISVDPDEREHEFKVDLGVTIELKLEPHDFDHFEIIFEDSWPPSERKPLTGSTARPISLSMPHKESTFKGHIVFKKDGTPKGKPVPFRAITCGGC